MSWVKSKERTPIVVVMRDRVGLLAEILGVIGSYGINIGDVHTKPSKDNVLCTMGLDTKDEELVKRLILDIRQRQDIIDARKK